MSLPTLLALLLALGIPFIPVWLLRNAQRTRAQDWLVSSQYTRPEVVRNASIAYALRIAVFGPLFAWGASGDLWPAILASACFGLGVCLIHALRQPLLAFLDDALSRDRSITVHAFIAQAHGNDPRVRVLAASFTVVALLGLLVGEALGMAAIVESMLPGSAVAVPLLVLGALLLSALPAIVSGHSGVMHSAQLQLGIVYLGLFGSTALLLYLHVSALTPMAPHGTFAVVFVAACCAIMLYYRRSRYVDTAPIRTGISSADLGRESWGARRLGRLGKILNACVSILLVLVIVLAAMEFQAAGLRAVVRDSAAALERPTRVPGIGLIALCLLPLLYPLVDVTNWQRLATARKSMNTSGVEAGRWSTGLRGVFRMYAVESGLVWLFMGMLGAIAVSAVETPRSADVLQAFVAQLVAGNDAGGIALPFLLICVVALALSTMGALFSASLCTIRYDLLATVSPKLAPGDGQAKEATAERRTLVAGGGLCFAIAVVFCIAEASLPIAFASSTFLALLFAVGCAQLSLAPLVLGAVVGRMRGESPTVSPGWALVVLAVGTASGIGAVAVYVVTGTEAWLWAAVPACLGSGAVLFTIARVASRHRRGST